MVKAHDDAIPVPKVIISMDPPEHEKMRKLVSKVFTPRAIDALEDMVREKVYERIEALDPTSVRRGGRLLGAVPERGDHHHARGAEGGPSSDPALAGPATGT